MQDPRWRQGEPERPASPSGLTREPRDSSPAGDRGNFSIVFSASWVHITTPIGEGAFSRVYEGMYTNPETSEQSIVAVKVLKKNMLKRRSDCLRFIKEAKIMTKITHGNIAACYGIGKYDDDDEQNPGSLFIVQELIKGGNLLHKVYRQMLNRGKCVYTSQEALSWMINVAEGMQYLHNITEGKPMIIHRDLKLENIMLSPSSQGTVAKLVDFGLHKVIDDRIKKVVKRVVSEAVIGSSRLRRPVQEEVDEDDELEVALAQQRQQKAEAEGGGSPSGSASPSGSSPTTPRGSRLKRSTSRLAMTSPVMESHPEEDEEGATEDAKVHVGGAAVPAAAEQPLCHIPEDAHPSESPADPRARVRAPPKKQSSMQKLMAKMKEIKLRVTGKLGESSSSDVAASSGSSTTQAAPAAATAEPENPMKEKMARNEELLNRIIAQQSTAQNEKQTILDDLGIADGATGNRNLRKPPPRRAVTWVNEVRYNLTEAVGSWAYMAPEVVLGHPYNEKVDVFSFGVILFEVLNRKLMLVDEIKNDPRKDAQAYAERVANGFRPEVPRRWPSDLVELITTCWAQDPHVRPNFTAVVDILREIETSGLITKLDVGFMATGSAFI